MKNTTILTLTACGIAIVFSLWFIINYPPSYPETHYEECKQYSTNHYEYGFCEGYSWALSGIELQKELDKIDPYKEFNSANYK